MGCNCGAKKINVSYVYTDTKGLKKSYNTLIEARAARIRAGNVGTITEEPANAK